MLLSHDMKNEIVFTEMQLQIHWQAVGTAAFPLTGHKEQCLSLIVDIINYFKYVCEWAGFMNKNDTYFQKISNRLYVFFVKNLFS